MLVLPAMPLNEELVIARSTLAPIEAPATATKEKRRRRTKAEMVAAREAQTTPPLSQLTDSTKDGEPTPQVETIAPVAAMATVSHTFDPFEQEVTAAFPVETSSPPPLADTMIPLSQVANSLKGNVWRLAGKECTLVYSDETTYVFKRPQLRD